MSAALPAESLAVSTLSRAFSTWARLASDSMVHSVSPLATLLPASLSKPVTVPLPTEYTVAAPAMDTVA